MTCKKQLLSLEETEAIGRVLGSNLRGGECIEFVSDLGGGKTTMTAAIVAAAGSRDIVSSPTFTIGKQYKSDSFHFYHFDFYRLHEPGLVLEELAEVVDSKQNVLIIEWGEAVRSVLPKERLVITIDRDPAHAGARSISFSCPAILEYLLKGILQ